jgi:lysophospholipase L1-like esterase
MKKITLLLLTVCLLSAFKQKQLTWVAIGDSITYLNDHKNETKYRLTRGYLTQVKEALPNIRYINKGYNGWTSGDIANRIVSLGLAKADVYSVFLGTNDWWLGRPIGKLDDYRNNSGNGTIYGSFRIIINKLKALNPKARIILITPMQRVDFVYIFDKRNNAYGSYKPKNNQTLEAVANAIAAIGKFENIAVSDLYHNKEMPIERLVKFKRLKDAKTGNYINYPYPQFIDIPFNAATDEYPYPAEATDLTYDGLHPSDAGCKVIANSLVKIMRKF